MYVVITGTPMDGFSFVGPFRSSEHAQRLMLDPDDSADWWIADLDPYPGQEAPVTDSIDAALLRKQRDWLLTHTDPHAEGLVNLCDALLDEIEEGNS